MPGTDTYDYTKDAQFLSAPAEAQHDYLLSVDKGYAKATTADQQDYLKSIGGAHRDATKETLALVSPEGKDERASKKNPIAKRANSFSFRMNDPSNPDAERPANAYPPAFPGTTEGRGLREGLAGYTETGPVETAKGGYQAVSSAFNGDFAHGVPRGIDRTLNGALTTIAPAALPLAPAAIASAPLSFAVGAGASALTKPAVKHGLEYAGANDDWSELGGDVASAGAGYLGAEAVPLVRKGASRALLLGKTPEEAYESALKPSTVIPEAKRAKIVNTGLREQIPVSKAGQEKISSAIEGLQDDVDAVIASDPKRPIKPAKAVSNLRETRKEFKSQVNPTADLNAIDASRDEFLDQFRSKPDGSIRDMAADEAQEMKKGTYKSLGKKAYGELKGASVEAQKSLARGIKDELAAQFPELSELNKREGALLELQDVLERAVNRIGNHQLLGIGTPIAAGAAKAITDSNKVAGTAAVIKAVLDNPNVKSRLAYTLFKAGMPLKTANAKISAYIGALVSSSSRAQSRDESATQGKK